MLVHFCVDSIDSCFRTRCVLRSRTLFCELGLLACFFPSYPFLLWLKPQNADLTNATLSAANLEGANLKVKYEVWEESTSIKVVVVALSCYPFTYGSSQSIH